MRLAGAAVALAIASAWCGRATAETLTVRQALERAGVAFVISGTAAAVAAECRSVPAGRVQSSAGTWVTWGGDNDFNYLTALSASLANDQQRLMAMAVSAAPAARAEIDAFMHEQGGRAGVISEQRRRLVAEAGSKTFLCGKWKFMVENNVPPRTGSDLVVVP